MNMSEREVKNFMSDPVWKVFKAEIFEMKNNVVGSMLMEEDSIKIYRSQGRAEVLEDLAHWPEIQLAEIQITKEEESDG